MDRDTGRSKGFGFIEMGSDFREFQPPPSPPWRTSEVRTAGRLDGQYGGDPRARGRQWGRLRWRQPQ